MPKPGIRLGKSSSSEFEQNVMATFFKLMQASDKEREEMLAEMGEDVATAYKQFVATLEGLEVEIDWGSVNPELGGKTIIKGANNVTE